MNNELIEIVRKEQERLKMSTNPNEEVNILNNLIVIKHNNPQIILENTIYVCIKMLINKYVELIKINDFGYDLFCYSKLFKVISFLNYSEQLSILNYLFSVLDKEFPQIEKECLIRFIKVVKIDKIFSEKEYKNFPQALLLYSSLDIKTLVISLFLFILLVIIILLPACFESMEIFKIKYESYSDNFVINHVLNVLTLFGDIKNGFVVTSSNIFGVILQLFGKITFILLIVNFIYKKISDKISN